MTNARDDESGFRIILETRISAQPGNIGCTVQAEYGLEALRANEVPADAMEEFINNVALMSLLPFVRQAIADITLRVFEAPLMMPIIKRGDLSFGLPDGVQD
ncbi:hypothetical protein DSM26151_05390 [Agromyces marinus]|nr:hypothetical protein DSM26151_05390 [Agromyces marinus]